MEHEAPTDRSLTVSDVDIPLDTVNDLEQARQLRRDLSRLMMEYQFAVDEVLTKVTILREEFVHLHSYNPIEHISSRVKTASSLVGKMARKNVPPDPQTIRESITDIAGIRITCAFIEDTYRVLETLIGQDDVRVIEVKDYIANPKPNGYKSIHAIIEIPVFLSTGPVQVPVELQIRTIAMDFWASLEHKIFYKFDGEVPDHLAESLSDAASIAERLDVRMEDLHREVHGTPAASTETPHDGVDDAVLAQLWRQLSAGSQSRGPLSA
ncbi:GTP pyrophosphokinase [Demequina flava]|uniref:GTP pyrophosphokinase n=1 Tax=Demequina flava TaxID=1095025 RepID=UPI0009E3DA19|nr:GTP pyrophosphokinase family protein [Demequina flava]